MKIALTKPITVEGKTLDEIDLNFEPLTGKDLLFCVREAQALKGERVAVIVTDPDVHVQVAAKASGLSAEAVLGLSIVDFTEVVTAVQGFLTRSL